ncbi:hypothetical protein JXA32_13090 [Candidatus Sumerlaeota bacterium]|nr:hypothetical protein [Candidatus Sumerlaeota bacterium]
MMHFSRRLIVCCALVCTMSGLFTASGFADNTNGNGVTLTIISTESDSYSSQSNLAGAQLELAGMSQQSVDTTNNLYATAYIGILAPVGGFVSTPLSELLRLYLLGLYPWQADFNANGDAFTDIADLLLLRSQGL